MNSASPQSAAKASSGDATESAPRPAAGLGLQAKLIVAGLAVCALAALFWPRGDGSLKVPGGFLLDGGGQAATLGPRLAPVTLVHFWATWCPPCLEEIPALQRLERDFAGHPGFGVIMVAVSDSSDKVRAFLGPEAGKVLYDPDWDVANRYGTDKLPETYLVVGGRIVEKFVGQTDWDAPALRRKLTERLAGKGGVQPAGS